MIDFSTPYKRNDFLVFLENFLPDDFREVEESYDDLNFATRYTVDATKLGTCGSLELDVFEITHTSSHDARVGIAQDAFRLMLHKSYNNRALVIFKQEGSRQYRFSLLQIEASQADNSSRITRSFSNPRRYSFLMGEGAHVKTPTQFLIEDGALTLKDGSYFNDLQERFSVEVLTKLFYKELSDWYFWALKQVKFPSEPTLTQATKSGKNHEDLVKEHNATNVIRMLTRLLFVWFIKQKGLIPEELFDENELENKILTELNPIKQTGMFSHTGKDSVYYKAILQNLFFASLNCPIKPQSDDEDKRERGFRREANYGDDFGNDWLFRYKKYFQKDYQDGKFVELINSKVPFLNGGLFECLDDKHNKIFVDGFSDNLPKNERLVVPDYIFFGRDENVDLSDDYGDTSPQFKQASVKGLINILKTYNFTVEENTPAEIEVALDPELLGKVFENLLASFNPETKTTARKQTGSFYTPREIVNYMVDESLIAYFKGKTEIEEERIRTLFQYTDEEHKLTSAQVEELVNALYECKILDPACGSGAFPMGILQKLVHILQKADPDNKKWEKVQKEKAEIELQQALDIDDKKDRENRLMEISNAFDVTKNTPDYARKLYLIENCIYGVDIQPIATQISKLRFFISLVVDQRNNTSDENFGIVPLPNLETKFVTANTLIGINRPTGQLSLSNTDEIKKLQEELRVCRHKIFSAKTKKTKQKYRQLDKEKRLAIANELKENGWNNTDADNLAGWDPYNQNASSPFFDPEWMFGLQRENGGLNSAGEGYFDIVIGNPPYIKEYTNRSAFDGFRETSKYYQGKMDLWYGFACHGLELLAENGVLCFIATNNWTTNGGASKLRNKVILDAKIIKLLDFGSYMIFEDSASIQTMILIFQNNKNNNDYIFDFRKLDKLQATKSDAIALLDKSQTEAVYLEPCISKANFENKLLTFTDNTNEYILVKIDCGIYFKNSEIAQGIVFPQDFLNKKSRDKLQKYNVGDGVFGLTSQEKSIFHLTKEEEELIKPYFTTEQIQRYITHINNKLWLIYTTSKFKRPDSLDDYPNIKRHLDKFTGIITSDNKPYGLHRAREERFFKGEKIISLRKCVGCPSFSYSDFDCYVSQTFYSIKTIRWNMKFLTGLLNSKLIEFWLRHKGKMQGDNFQVDKEPLLNIPIKTSETAEPQIALLVTQIIEAKQANPQADTSALEAQIDQLVYELYGLTPEEIDIIEGN